MLAIVFFAFHNETIVAQSATLMIQAGLSKDMRSVTENLWNAGPNFAVSYFIKKSERLSIGGQISYHRWKVDEKGSLKEFEGSTLDTYSTYSIKGSSGTQTVFEITPSARYALSEANAPVRFSVQAGVNIVFAKESDIKIGYDYTAPNTIGFREIVVRGQSLTGFGIQVGLPITISNRVEGLPLYSPYMVSGDIYHHFAANLGITLDI